MKNNTLAKAFTKYEGKKSQVSFSNSAEIIGVLAALLMAEQYAAQGDESKEVLHANLNEVCAATLAKLEKKFKEPKSFEEMMAYLIKKPAKKKKKAPVKSQKAKSKKKKK